MATEDEIWGVEEAMESEFLRILSPVTQNVYRSRERASAQTPWVEILFLVGETNTSRDHSFDDYQDRCWDAWNSTLQIEVHTQRQNNGAQHAIILRKIRGLLQRYKLAPNWEGKTARVLNWTQPVHCLDNIIETGTTHALDSDTDVDISTITFGVTHHICPNAWPVSLESYLSPDSLFTYVSPDSSIIYVQPNV